jgi:D-tyrosyl-tRNA(Tyr) deacylase
MRILIQRVTRASVRVNGELAGEIGTGILALTGIAAGDGHDAADYLADKLVNLRIFPDEDGRMNLSALNVRAGLLLVSQFTLYGDCRKGRRPGFDAAAGPTDALRLYEYFVDRVRAKGLLTQTGVFQAHVNDGPVTFLLDSP